MVKLYLEREDVEAVSGYKFSDYKFKNMKVTGQTEEEKIKLMDSFTEGGVSYILELIDKYNEALNNGTIKITSWGSPNGNSLTSFFKKEDPRNIVSSYYDEGVKFYAFGTDFRMSRNYTSRYTDERGSIIDVMFSRFVNRMRSYEEDYFEETDEFERMITAVEDSMDMYWLKAGNKTNEVWEEFNCIGTRTREYKREHSELTRKVAEVYSQFEDKVAIARKEAEEKLEEIVEELNKEE